MAFCSSNLGFQAGLVQATQLFNSTGLENFSMASGIIIQSHAAKFLVPALHKSSNLIATLPGLPASARAIEATASSPACALIRNYSFFESPTPPCPSSHLHPLHGSTNQSGHLPCSGCQDWMAVWTWWLQIRGRHSVWPNPSTRNTWLTAAITRAMGHQVVAWAKLALRNCLALKIFEAGVGACFTVSCYELGQ